MFAVIMAGGRGTRFWPRSRQRLPKHLLDIVSDRTLIQETVDRIRPLAPPENILVVTGADHADELIRQLPELPRANILVEPIGRNTAPCIGYAAAVVRKRAGDHEVMLVLPADHRIGNPDAYRRVLAAAAEAARSGALVTVGIRPTGPETGYGYLEQGALWGTVGDDPVYAVRSIREKPDYDTACGLLDRGGFLWNSGMFVWTAGTILAALEQHLPAVAAGIGALTPELDTARETEALKTVYPGFPSISIDYGVMEKADNTLLVPGDFGWSDVGSWDALWEISEKDGNGVADRGRGNVESVNARNCLVDSGKKAVALVGVEDLIVVETEDALLVCRRGDSQSVRNAVERLAAEGKTELL